MIAFLGLGSNVGERLLNLLKVVPKLEEIGIIVEKTSPIYETSPMYNLNQDNFFNQVIKVNTDFDPEQLLKNVKQIELEMGRDLNSERNSERIIDIDILAFEDLNYKSNILNIPHPLLHERQFVLQPWNDIEPDYIVPEYEKTVNQLFSKLTQKENLSIVDHLEVTI